MAGSTPVSNIPMVTTDGGGGRRMGIPSSSLSDGGGGGGGTGSTGSIDAKEKKMVSNQPTHFRFWDAAQSKRSLSDETNTLSGLGLLIYIYI